MRDTLENLYFGNITPNDQIVKSGTALKKAMEQSAECEEKLTALLEDKEKALLLRLINAENEIGSTMALENFILGFRLGVRMILEALDEDDGSLIDPNKEGYLIKFYNASSKVSFCLAERRQISYDEHRRCRGRC